MWIVLYALKQESIIGIPCSANFTVFIKIFKNGPHLLSSQQAFFLLDLRAFNGLLSEIYDVNIQIYAEG
jgi:hypothetical protein